MTSFGRKIGDRTYAWTQVMNPVVIKKRSAHEKVAKFITITTILGLSVAGILALVLLFIEGPGTFSLTFWMTPSWATVSVWFTGLLGLFLFYHHALLDKGGDTMPAGIPSEIEEITLSKGVKNIGELFTHDATAAVETAYELAVKFGHLQVEALHLFIGVMDTGEASVAFSRLGLSFEDMQEALGRRLSTRELGKPTVVGELGQKTLLRAFGTAVELDRPHVTSLEIFAASFFDDPFLGELLLESGVNQEQFTNMVEWLRIHERMRERYDRFRTAAAHKSTGTMNSSMTSLATPTLDAVSEDLTLAAASGRLPMLVERDSELEELFRIIEGGRQSVLLVGPSGVGKNTLLAGVAELMVEEKVPDVLKDRRLVRISVPHLVSGTSPAEAQERFMEMLSEVAKSRNIILAISDIDQLIAGGGAMDLASTLVDFLSRSGTFVVATTSPQQYVAVVEQSVLSRVFQKIEIKEPDNLAAIHMLQSKIGGIESEQKVIFSYGAVEKAVTLSDRYMHESYLPKKAIEIAQEAGLLAHKERGDDTLVSGEDIAAIISSKTGIPTQAVEEDEKEKLLGLEDRMHARVIGQEEAVKAVAAALRRARTQLRSEGRPIATFLFLGSTGVGKTELAKTVAQTYFGDENMMIRLDMSEYQAADSIDRLLGTPSSQKGGLLTEAVRKTPFAIVLLDELEKAHPDILNVFLQVFEDGRLTDSAGRTIDFTNTIVIATSNAGTQYIQDAVARGDDLESIKTVLLEEELKSVYRPEFLNRFDGVIVFTPLTEEQVIKITELFMVQVARHLEPKGIGFRADPEAVRELGAKGYDPKFGARPLRRLVQEEVDNAIANALLEGRVGRRDTIVLKAGGGIEIEKGSDL